jgi:hypothetical protein
MASLPRAAGGAPRVIATGAARAGAAGAHGRDRHHRVVAVGEQDAHLARDLLSARDAHRCDLAAQAQIARHELERPLPGIARHARLEQPLEHAAVAGQRAADRLDDHGGLRRRVELHRAAAFAEAHRQRVAFDRELFVARLQRLANEHVGRLEREPAGRDQRAVEHLDPARLDEGRLARLDAGEECHQGAEIERRRGPSAARAEDERRRERQGRDQREREAPPLSVHRLAQAHRHRHRPRNRRS